MDRIDENPEFRQFGISDAIPKYIIVLYTLKNVNPQVYLV